MIALLFGMNAAMAEPLSLEDSLAMVSSQNPEVQIARLQADQANLERLKVLTNLVNVQASGSWLDFGEPLDSYIIGDGSEEVDCSSFESFGFGDLCASFSEPLRVRDERIFDGSIQVAIPISALYSIIEGHKAAEHMHEVKGLEIEQTRQRIELSVLEIYLQTLEMQSQKEILTETLHRLSNHERSVKAFVAQGFAHPVQAKELAHAIRQTKLGMTQLNQGFDLLCKQMELLLGLETSFEPMALPDGIQGPEDSTVESSLTHRIATHQFQAAQAGAHAAMGDLLPTIAVMGATTAAQGQGPFTPTSQQYIGLSLQGQLGWGQKWMTYKQRQMDVTMAEQGLKLQQEAQTIQQERLKQHWQHAKEQVDLAKDKVEIEDIKLKQAQAKFNAHQLTTTELLDAESQFSEAQIALLRSAHQHLLAQAKYQQSLNSSTLTFE